MSNILNIYESVAQEKKDAYQKSINSTLKVKQASENTTYDDEWITKMEETIIYLDNILRNPNRFIVNEEEIVKVEKVRRTTIESIKHLSRNTNLIQDFNQKTGEVRPSKLLNINKEESFNTYENRFIHTLINNMKMFIEKKKKEDILPQNSKNEKNFEYKGSGEFDDESVQIELVLNSKLGNKKESKSENTLEERIEKLEEKIRDLCSNEVYKNLTKLHFAPVISPIKKTNLILKNTNFQYALDLWNFLQSDREVSTKVDKNNKDYMDDGDLKKYMDESFILDYLVMKTLDGSSEEKSEVTDKVINNMVSKLIDLNDEMALEEIKKKIGDEFVKIKYRNKVTTAEIEKIYKKAISDYSDKISNLRVRKNERKDKQDNKQ